MLGQEGGICPPTGGFLNRTLVCQPWSDHPPTAQAGSREGFHSDIFFTNSRRGREALKCNLTPKTQQQVWRAWACRTPPPILLQML